MPAHGEFIPGTMIDNLPFPSYGTGKVIVRVYTVYFCSPCRAAEPELESLLLELIKSKKISVVFVNTPVHRESQIYARYFLYALKKKMTSDTPSRSDQPFLELRKARLIPRKRWKNS
jgi:protein-disulfide isomerase